MYVTVQITHCSSDVRESGLQAVEVFGHDLAFLAEQYPALDMGELAICLCLSAGASYVRGGSYDKDTRTFYASADIDYSAWTVERWDARMDSLAEATARAIGKVHKTRLTVEERATLLALVEAACAQAKASPPAVLATLSPIFLVYGQGNATPSISYQQPLEIPGMTKVVEVAPSEAQATVAAWQAQFDTGPAAFKLYQRVDGRLNYYEAWPTEGAVVGHRGVCGERGEVRDHPTPDAKAQTKVLKTLKAEARAQGFRPIAPSRHVGLLVEVAIDGFGEPSDIDRRHALENFLNDLTGWLGLGHCDGGSIGSGAMEAYCLVADFPVAKAAIEAALAQSPFADFTVRRAEA